MSNYQKYINYKTKYLILKNKINQVGGDEIPVGTIVSTKENGGSMENMTNQCFWISILHFLHANGQDLSLLQLRTNAGLNSDTKDIEFDNFLRNSEGIYVYDVAAQRIANRYNLILRIYEVDENGIVQELRQRYLPENPHSAPLEVDIAQFGQFHFQWINGRNGVFVPKIPINGVYRQISEFTGQVKSAYEELTVKLKKLNIQIKKNRDERTLQINSLHKHIPPYTDEQKNNFKRDYERDLNIKNEIINKQIISLNKDFERFVMLSSQPVSTATSSITPLYTINQPITVNGSILTNPNRPGTAQFKTDKNNRLNVVNKKGRVFGIDESSGRNIYIIFFDDKSYGLEISEEMINSQQSSSSRPDVSTSSRPAISSRPAASTSSRPAASTSSRHEITIENGSTMQDLLSFLAKK